MSKAGRAAVAVLAAAAVLWLAGWADGTVMRDIQQQEAATFDPTGLSLAYALGAVAVASGVLVLAVLAWRSRSALVGVAYLIVGGFFGFMPVINWWDAAQINEVPPVLPGPSRTPWARSTSGPTGRSTPSRRSGRACSSPACS
jgi:hypothetical protein